MNRIYTTLKHIILLCTFLCCATISAYAQYTVVSSGYDSWTLQHNSCGQITYVYCVEPYDQSPPIGAYYTYFGGYFYPSNSYYQTGSGSQVVCDPCANQGGDSDNDGICNYSDCAPYNSSLPATPGTSCNDGNPNTTNDVVQSDGCTCQGTPVDPCDPVAITAVANPENCKISVSWDASGATSIQLKLQHQVNGSWVLIENWTTTTDNPKMYMITEPGKYRVRARSAEPDCNNSSTNTTWTVIDNVACTTCIDTDGDSICDDNDCAPNDPQLPKPGGFCPDYEICPGENIVIQPDLVVSQPCFTNCAPEDFIDVVEIAKWKMEQCVSVNNSNLDTDYTELKGFGKELSCGTVTRSALYRFEGTHGCTTDSDDGHLGDALGVEMGDAFYQDDATKALRFDVTIDPSNGTSAITMLRLKEHAPANYVYSQVGYNTSSGINNYPTRFGIRVVKNGEEIFKQTNINTSVNAWGVHVFDFSTFPGFQTSESATYQFELLAYAPVDNGSLVHQWSLDDIKVWGGCCQIPVSTNNEVTYQWSNGSTTPTIEVAPTETTSYAVSVIDCDGTTHTEEVLVWVKSQEEDPNCIPPNPCPADSTFSLTTGWGYVQLGGFGDTNPVIEIFNNENVLEYSCSGDCPDPLVLNTLENGQYVAKVKLYSAQGDVLCSNINEPFLIRRISTLEGQSSDFFFFTAAKQGRKVGLNWVINSAMTTDRFVIERSINEIDFEPVLELVNASEMEGTVSFDGLDQQPRMGENHYRIKQIFKDGTHRYSKVETVSFNLDLVRFEIYPNPTTSILSVNLSQYSGSSAEILLTNGFGHVITTRKVDNVSLDPISFDVESLPAGLYGISVKIEGRKRVSKRFVKERL